MKSYFTHFSIFLTGVILAAWIMMQIWPVGRCAEVLALDQPFKHSQDQTIRALQANLDLSQQQNARLRAAQPVKQQLTAIEKEVQSIKVLAAQRTPIEAAIKDEAKTAGSEAFTMPWWKQQALRLAAGRR